MKKLEVSPAVGAELVEKDLNELMDDDEFTGGYWNFQEFDEERVEEVAANHYGGSCKLVWTIDRSQPIYTEDGAWTAYARDWIFKVDESAFLIVSYQETPSCQLPTPKVKELA